MENCIINYFKKLNTEIDNRQAKAFVTYKNLLVQYNKVMNLTGITGDKEVMIKHFADSVTALNIADFKNKSVIDVGTGAGFPGLPLKIAEPSIKLTLLDSLTKRLNFLEDVCRSIGVDAEFVHGRAEDLGKDEYFREKFDIAVSRAVAPLNVLAEFDLPYVKAGGLMIALKGPAAYDEIKGAENAVTELGGEIMKVEEVALPETDLKHTLVVIKKIKNTPEKYPRRAKKIERNPL
ncbi:MAG: 16S rRNA (guanine(527)-N(7))-methyltransferase RsmG [Clostridia bacterium]|nr:16S rRNA (guanine(527)-N(7))-methyltransferase RsmG [Clostridia bacterium]